MKEVTGKLQVLQVTLEKANKTLDDINVKLDMLNAPIEMVSGFFNRDRARNGFLASFLAAKSMFKKKSK